MIDAAGEAYDGRERHAVGDVFQGVEIALDEGRAFEEVEREIAADAEFGEGRQVQRRGAWLVPRGRECGRSCLQSRRQWD